MDLFSAVAPELVEPIRKMPTMNFDSNLKRTLGQLLGFRKAPLTPGVSVRNQQVGATKVRIFEPENAGTGALIWIHGGGLILGRPEQDDQMCSEIAKELKVKVFALGYRVAPKHPYPTPLDDCHTGFDWVVAHATELGIDRTNIVLAGASAGGCLATSLVLRLRDAGNLPKATALLYPMLDDRTGANKSLDGTSLIWTNRSNRWAWSQYLGYPAGSKEPIGYSVPGRVENLNGLCPTWIGVGDIDLFYKEDVDFANRLLMAGVETQLKIFKGFPHAAESLAPDTDIAKTFKADLKSFIRQQLMRGN